MKTRFTTIDLQAAIAELQQSDAMGLRVFNVYDIDNKTYLIRLTHGDKKIVVLIESGSRIHLTEYDWPKNMMPSGFSMKCRKHLKGRRLASVKQLGIDRIVDFTFGYDVAAYHLIVELYDRGNIVLTDYSYQVLQLLRSRTDADKDVKFAVRETYPIDHARQYEPLMEKERLREILLNSKAGDQLKRTLNPLFVYGTALIEHCLLNKNMQPNCKMLQQFHPEKDEEMDTLMNALKDAEVIFNSTKPNGFIIQKKEKRVKTEQSSTVDDEDLLAYTEFHPFLFTQHKSLPHIEFPSFNKCLDEFYSKLESQKFEMKALQIEKAALKRLENVKQDHETRLKSLQESQDEDSRRAELIEMNLPLVEHAIATINSAIANQIDWEEINEILQEAKAQSDPVAMAIKSLKLETNQIILLLREPFTDISDGSDDENEEGSNKSGKEKPMNVLINLDLTAFANARSLHDKRRQAASKEQKTIHASKKALKSAEQKTKETLKEIQTSKLISKTRKTYWFEKFYWFISSENYLVIGGRDQQQNELAVKRYLKPGDLYVHADLHGASSVIIKNHSGVEVPPKTLNEAGTMAICYSAAWDARVVTSAWWVHHHQVSKTAPSGEYLTTGSFMIRGKKNYLPPSYLIMGYSVLFKLDESSIGSHLSDRKVRLIEENEIIEEAEEEEINLSENSSKMEDENIQDGENLTRNESVSVDTEDIEYVELRVNKLTLDNTCDVVNNKIENNCKQHKEDLLDISTATERTNSGSNVTEEELNQHMFPDTSIQLQHISGETFQLHRGMSSASTQPDEVDIDDDDFIYLGDGEKIRIGKQEPENRKPKLSAKQRRDLKKSSRPEENGRIKTEIDEAKDDNLHIKPKSNTKAEKQTAVSQSPSPAPTPTPDPSPLQQAQKKRRQKSKDKKIKEKYKDQDEDDRELMQQILRSHEPEKPARKKGKEKRKEKNKQQQQQQQQNKPPQKPQKTATDDTQPQILHVPDENSNPPPGDKRAPVEDQNDNDDDDDDNTEEFDKENISVLDSLTGCPLKDDILLYAIPVCAPYSCLQNYKFKVKVMPGSGKRGRAAKTAIGMFQTSKEVTEWERDLLKALKDVDISRNIPGKVKISAPNLQKAKKK